jgi:hypothetical protein
MTKKNKRAPGAGRKALPYRTTTIRVPFPILEEIKAIIKNWKRKKGY